MAPTHETIEVVGQFKDDGTAEIAVMIENPVVACGSPARLGLEATPDSVSYVLDESGARHLLQGLLAQMLWQVRANANAGVPVRAINDPPAIRQRREAANRLRVEVEAIIEDVLGDAAPTGLLLPKREPSVGLLTMNGTGGVPVLILHAPGRPANATPAGMYEIPPSCLNTLAEDVADAMAKLAEHRQ